MKKLFFALLLLLPVIAFAQPGGNIIDTTGGRSLTQLVFSVRIYREGDTIVNMNSLNNGIIKTQVSKESRKVIKNNGLQLNDSTGIVTLVEDSLLKQDFIFDIKTFASDNEWYENTVKVKVKNNDIRLISVTSDKIEMATGFRKEGKIYVVIAVSMILFFTIIIYLVYLERKTKKLEKQINNNK